MNRLEHTPDNSDFSLEVAIIEIILLAIFLFLMWNIIKFLF